MKEVASIILDYFQRHPYEVAFNVIVSCLVMPVQDVLLPHLYGKVIAALEDKKNIIKPLVIVIIAIVVIQIGFSVSDWHDTTLMPHLQAFLRVDLLKKIFNNFQTDFQDLNIGDILSSLIKIPNSLSICFERMKNYIIPYIISYIIAIAYFTYHDLHLGIALGIMLSIYIVLLIGSPFMCQAKSKERDVAHNNLYEEIDDILRNLISVFTSDQQENELKRLDAYEKKYTTTWEKTMYCALRSRFYIMPIIIGFLLFFVLRCYKNITVGNMPPSKLVPLFMILFYILGSMMTLTDQIKELIFEIGSLSNVEGIKPILNKTDFKCNAASPYKFPSTSIGQRGILFDNVTYIYPNAIQPILKDVNLFIRGGEKIGIVGDIGSGKSTLLKLLLKLKKPTCGDIYVNGHPYKNIKIKDIRSFIGYVPQQPILFNRSVVDNIKYGNPHITNEHVESIINNLGLQEEFSQLEKGIHTKIGKNGTKISGGQRQLVWCIRVLLSNPEILILDEPTASLDTKTKKLMISLLDRLMQNRTVIMVTHDPDLVKYADRLIVVQKGSIINHQNVANR